MTALADWLLSHWFLIFFLAVLGVFGDVRDFFVDTWNEVTGVRHKRRMKELKAREWAARAGTGACNLIASRGPEATQSVYHLHLHLIPRLKHDGLALPWTGQEERQEVSFGELDEHLRPVDFSDRDMWHIAAWLPRGREGEVAAWLALHGISLYRMYQSADLVKELRELRKRREEAAP